MKSIGFGLLLEVREEVRSYLSSKDFSLVGSSIVRTSVIRISKKELLSRNFISFFSRRLKVLINLSIYFFIISLISRFIRLYRILLFIITF